MSNQNKTIGGNAYREMHFKSILIADIQEKTAFVTYFKTGLNVVTSSENHVGKSSILKSLYYTLGADVRFDDRWDKDSKLTVVSFAVNGTEYRIARYLRSYAVFLLDDKKLKPVLITDKVIKELAPTLGKIFDFAVYLKEKKTGKENNAKMIQTPPAFTFMPYYIDQDTGWSELYGSFQKTEQFSKPERAKTVYYHLGIYTELRMQLQNKKDKYNDKLMKLQQKRAEFVVIIKALSKELDHLVPVKNTGDLERQLQIPQKEIEGIVREIGVVRNRIQKLQTELQEHEYQLDLMKSYQKKPSKELYLAKKQTKLHTCPRCGYVFDDELNALIRENYNQSNEQYLVSQVELIIQKLRKKLLAQHDLYINLNRTLKEKERVYDETKEPYKVYLRFKGLGDTLHRYQHELGQAESAISGIEEEIKKVNKSLRDVPSKANAELKYKEYVEKNLQYLGAWNSIYDKKIKLTKAITAQGSLMPKIIISQFIGLYQTMDSLSSTATRFPFVVDSPRSFESSDRSSKEILELIAGATKYVPQVILATVDYDKFDVDIKKPINEIYLKKQFHLLEKEIYDKNKDDIEGLYSLLRQ